MKKVLIISFLIFTIILGLFNVSYAKPITISENDFTTALSIVLDSFGYLLHPVDTEDNKIKIFDLSQNHVSTITYDLNTLTFKFDVSFENITNNFDFQFRDIALHASIYGTLNYICTMDYADSIQYFLENFYSTPSYGGIDSNVSESEFSNHVINLVKNYYSTKRVTTDKSSLNSFELTRKLKNSSSTSCTVENTLKIKRDYLTHKGYLASPENITKNNADHVIELYVGKTISISLGKYTDYDVSNDYNCIASKSKGNTINITGNSAGIGKIILHSKNNYNTETYYITVKPLPKVIDVLIIPPTKTHYDVGENLDLNGLIVSAVYDNDTIKQISDRYTVKGYNKNKEGKQTVTISYEGFSRSFNVKVGNSSDIVVEDVEDIENIQNIEKLPQTGDFFDLVDGLYLLITILSLILICLVYKSIKHSK